MSRRLLPPALTLVEMDTVDSTSEEIRRRALAGAGDGLLLWARQQTNGRGRQGRVWHSPPGNLYCSLLLRPPPPAAQAAQLSFVAALAVAEAVEGAFEGAAARPTVRLKWPNDVLLGGAKAAGILLESVPETSAGDGFVIVGIGVNVASYPRDVGYAATSLQAAGGRSDVAALLGGIGKHWLAWLDRWRKDGFQPVRAAWLDRAAGLGARTRVRVGNDIIEGVFEGLDASGAMVLALADGGRRPIPAGDVLHAA
jgi:BirA family transcriptional regulator, biotin operon repressor / biotin---[acetyl-CoA-carboxylase] ligase